MASREVLQLDGREIPVYGAQALVVGTGAAGLNAAVHLYDLGVRDVLIITERDGAGTSNNSGSDKQTYYKMSVEGGGGDSPLSMAQDLAAGGCMHGDVALVESTLSAQEFFHLVQMGVPFPHHRYGGYVGYKTDHDLAGRGTSAGPRTSNMMYRCLRREVDARGIEVHDGELLVALLTDETGERVLGAASINRKTEALTLYNAPQIILATGGAGELYRHTVYPPGQLGSIGVALEAGAPAHNLTESQFGLGSTRFRWNLSGTYQQVVPKYYSEDPDGTRHDFLTPVFGSIGKTADAIFLKGYQWPFDPKKVPGMGSSLVDLLVHRETVEYGRTVYMDFRENLSPEFSLDRVGPETREYLEKSGALQPTPIERLRHMNEPAIQLYLDHGIDLADEPLACAVNAQHSNGGLAADCWWQSPLQGLFPVGEVNGSHGVYRPGGSALNSGQAGGLRAAQYIAANGSRPVENDAFGSAVARDLRALQDRLALFAEAEGDGKAVRGEIQDRMSHAGAHLRTLPAAQAALGEAKALLNKLAGGGGAGTGLVKSFENYHLAVASVAYLAAIEEYLLAGGGSRGSAMVLGEEGEPLGPGLPEAWRMVPEKPELRQTICEVRMDGAAPKVDRVPVRPVPTETFWFENVWNAYMRREVVR
jgi:succinate dehydrogenase/fumarate reductase flavoprotein subunit